MSYSNTDKVCPRSFQNGIQPKYEARKTDFTEIMWIFKNSALFTNMVKFGIGNVIYTGNCYKRKTP